MFFTVPRSALRNYSAVGTKRYFFTLMRTQYIHSMCCTNINVHMYRSQWPHGVRRGSVAARLLGLRGFESLWKHGYLSLKSCVLSGGGLCDGLITRPEESYRVWCV